MYLSPCTILAPWAYVGKVPTKNHFYFKNTKNLFIHIARIPIGDSPRDIPTF